MVWMTTMQSGLKNKTEEAAGGATEKLTKTVNIVSVDCTNDDIYLRNTGSETIESGELTVFINGTNPTSNSNPISPDSIEPISVTVTSGDEILVSGPAGETSESAQC